MQKRWTFQINGVPIVIAPIYAATPKLALQTLKDKFNEFSSPYPPFWSDGKLMTLYGEITASQNL